MKRQTRRNRYEKHRPIKLPKERPVQQPKEQPVQPTSQTTTLNDWYEVWYQNHRTQEQMIEMHNWHFRWRFQMPTEQYKQYRSDCFKYASLSNTPNEIREYWDKEFYSFLSDEQRNLIELWFHQWFNTFYPNPLSDKILSEV